MALAVDQVTVDQLREDLALAEAEAERLTGENARLRAALAPFARAAASFAGDDPDGIFKISTLRVRHLRSAQDAVTNNN